VEASLCPICGSACVSHLHSGQLFSECTGCGYGLLAVRGRGDYWADSHEQRHATYWEEAKLRYFDRTLELLASIATGRRLLDVGGGLGVFAERALGAGWDAYTLDVSPTVTELAAKRVGAHRAWSSLPQDQAGTLDAVSLWCVVAHTANPRAVIQVCRRALRPGGVLWLTTPNFAFQRPYAYVRGRLGNPLDFGRDDHIGHFTAKSLRLLLEGGGFEEIAFRFEGVTETCIAAGSSSGTLVAAKKAWNRAESVAQRAGLPNLMSELQVTARLAAGPENDTPDDVRDAALAEAGGQ
jgi:SAM-dependent methyltransferase